MDLAIVETVRNSQEQSVTDRSGTDEETLGVRAKKW